MPEASTHTNSTMFCLPIGSYHNLSTPIPKKNIKKTVDKTPKEECPICLKNIKTKDFVVTKCGHKFCSKCIFTNFTKAQNGNHCPMCRTTFAPAFCTNVKKTRVQVANAADSVMDKFWREDRKLYRTSSAIQRRYQLIHSEYETYIQENGYSNVPYLKLMDYMREVLKNCSDKDSKITKLHNLMDDFLCTSFSENLAEKIKVLA